MTVTLEPFSSPITTTHSLLGMVVADVTTAMDEAYDLGTSKGVMIVDPGKRSDDFGIGKLRPGYVFWQVGNRSAGDLRTILNLLDLVRDAKSRAIPPGQEGIPSAPTAQNGDLEVDVLYSY